MPTHLLRLVVEDTVMVIQYRRNIQLLTQLEAVLAEETDVTSDVA